jgi:ribose/xylose/arabinose/galactoside ABC-type transport system permease subunit
MVNVLLQSTIRGVAAVGQAFVMLTAGIDLSIGGVGLMTGILGASIMTEFPWLNIVGYPFSPYIVIPIMLLVGAAWGALNGSLVSRIGMPPLIATLGMWEICKGVAFHLCKGRDLPGQPLTLLFFGQGRVAGVPVPVIMFIALAVVAYFVLEYTTFGRSVYAVGGNPVAAWLSGIKVKNTQFMVYVISGLLAALGGLISTARTMSASMTMLPTQLLDTIAAVCIGGVSLRGGSGSLIGVVIGVLIISVIRNFMSVMAIDPFVQGVVTGAIIITAVAIDYLRRR